MRLETSWLKASNLCAVVAALGESAVFFVGGCVRNTLLDQPVADIDPPHRSTPPRSHAAWKPPA